MKRRDRFPTFGAMAVLFASLLAPQGVRAQEPGMGGHDPAMMARHQEMMAQHEQAMARMDSLAAAMNERAEANAAFERLVALEPDYKDARQRLDNLH